MAGARRWKGWPAGTQRPGYAGPMQTDEILNRAAGRLASAESVAILTGAGVSAESGVPTFRGHGGLWEGRRPEQLASPEAFARSPEDVWRFYLWRRDLLAGLRPNPGHRILARWQDRFPGFRLITQNVDGLHQAAGSREVLELHGSLWRVRCTGCGVETETREVLPGPIPTCQDCGAALRPAVVWFGEVLPEPVLRAALEAARDCDLFLCIGTSSLVHPAAGLAWEARQSGAVLIEINLEATPLTRSAHIALQGPAGEILPDLDRRIP